MSYSVLLKISQGTMVEPGRPLSGAAVWSKSKCCGREKYEVKLDCQG